MNFFLIVVSMMMFTGFSKTENLQKFNSSFVIEVTRPQGVFTCSGVAVSKNIILTAGHCLEGSIHQVRVFNQFKYNPYGRGLKIKSFGIHPQYNPEKSRYRFDLAKINLQDELSDDIIIYPITSLDKVSGNFYRFGYGMRQGENLRTMIFPRFRRLNNKEDVLELDDEFSKSGDSGGPIFFHDQQGISIVAIHSTYSFGPMGNYSLNPLLGKELYWIFH